MDIPISLPLDEGFLRRECPNCERQFKWFYSKSTSNVEGEAEDITSPEAFCPYCYETGVLNTWQTKEQAAYVIQIVQAQVLSPEIRKFQKSLKSLNSSKGAFRFESKPVVFTDPAPLEESNDMVRVEFPCHLTEPLKVDPEWHDELACLVCGMRYPAELVQMP